ncbi:hypothetical protein CERSUDRAFT_91457 [Gelatoporia subvermispora B]|uniref:Uncharacterized protein n=1 Tax=Ceriporiopsis subvermispora (strain B) TaxID=914234 RepID=M2RPB6_CERS8|nr:hypothetical protein CERSUDRAFT_91457 [Gelatoporia subvermispora B]
MSNFQSFDTPDSPPPPAYELSQQEFDQKTSHVIETSSSEPQQPAVDLEGFEVWDDAIFESAVRMSGLSLDGTSSRLPEVRSYAPEKASQLPSDETASSSSVQPLRIQKKTAVSMPPQKERPSWYAEAQLDRSCSTAVHERDPTPLPSSPSQSSQHDVPGSLTPPSREATPPPEFTPVGPSLDGPPYEVVLTYRPSDGDSAPPSPLQSPTMLPQNLDVETNLHTIQSRVSRELPMPPQSGYGVATSSIVPHHHQSLPAPRRSPLTHHMRPSTTYASGFGAATPLLRFNPQTAYGKKQAARVPEEQPAPPRVDPAAFYNSAVSATLSANNATTRPRPLTPNPAASTSRPMSHYPQPSCATPNSQSCLNEGQYPQMLGYRSPSPAPSMDALAGVQRTQIIRSLPQNTHTQSTYYGRPNDGRSW